MITRINTAKLQRSLKRERKRNKRTNGMKTDGASVKNIQRIQQERAIKIQQRRKLEEQGLT